MKLKLLIIKNRINFGSTIYFSENVSPYEKKVLESINYKDYIKEIEKIKILKKDDNYIYFLSYTGGKDEFGRDYINTISAIFPIKLDQNEMKILKKILESIEDEIEKGKDIIGDYDIILNSGKDGEVFSNIKIKNRKKTFRDTLIGINLLLFIVVIIGFGANYSLNRTSYRKMLNKVKKESDYYKKYILYSNFLDSEYKRSIEFKEKAAIKDYNEIIKIYNSNNYKNREILNKIENYINDKKFEYHKKEILGIRTVILKSESKKEFNKMINLVKEYNKTKNYETLKKIENLLYKYKKSNFKLYKKNILLLENEIERLKKGITSEIEIYINNKSYIYNNKKLIFVIKLNNKVYKKIKKVNNNKEDYIGSFYGDVVPKSEINVKVYLNNLSKDNLINSVNMKVSDINNNISIKNNDVAVFKVRLSIRDDFFIIHLK
ncbi:hypothetical protein [Haliovirga abyssi]|uniref:Uncharacterized protein n=1 Tax=Haliovirga abyssi TaxID=2996794 RepID=A0AAU9DKR5_9FUSO|nr:hypothetical protein [Haliovirga abyssi]BDU51524.1 hypothetical protein HLVA_20930 [Haliovirga abyssi]